MGSTGVSVVGQEGNRSSWLGAGREQTRSRIRGPVPQGTTPSANRPQQAMAKGKGTFDTFLLVESE